jgi:hypothetical protein
MDLTKPPPPRAPTSTDIAGDSKSLDCQEASEKKANELSPSGGSGDDMTYPPMREVIPIMLALCSAMFLYALVSLTSISLQNLTPLQICTNFHPRTAVLSQPPYPESPMNSTPSATSAGTPASTCLPRHRSCYSSARSTPFTLQNTCC